MKKQKRPRNTIVVAMILHCKGGFMKHRNTPRGGSRNKQKDIIKELWTY